MREIAVDVLSFFEDTGPAFVHFFHGGGRGEEGVVRGVERGRAAVSLFYRQRAGSVLQSLHNKSRKKTERNEEKKRNKKQLYISALPINVYSLFTSRNHSFLYIKSLNPNDSEMDKANLNKQKMQKNIFNLADMKLTNS